MPNLGRTSCWCFDRIQAVHPTCRWWGEQGREHSDGGGLARAVGAEEREDLALGHFKGNIVTALKSPKCLTRF